MTILLMCKQSNVESQSKNSSFVAISMQGGIYKTRIITNCDPQSIFQATASIAGIRLNIDDKSILSVQYSRRDATDTPPPAVPPTVSRALSQQETSHSAATSSASQTPSHNQVSLQQMISKSPSFTAFLN